MANIQQPVRMQGQSQSGAPYNVANPSAQVIYMPPATEQNISYANVFNKKHGLTLSIIQIVNAALVISTDVMASKAKYSSPSQGGPTFWCGILFGISGTVGLIASIRPGFTTIVTLMVFNIVAQVCCFPLFVSSFQHYREHNIIGFIQTSVCAVQFVAAIVSSSMTCKATRCCCNPKRQEGVVYYTNNGGIETTLTDRIHNATTSPTTDFPQQFNNNNLIQQQSGYMTTAMRQQSGYMTTPVNQNPIVTSSQLSVALPNESLTIRSNILDAESPPPTYETAANYRNREASETFGLKKGGDETK